MLSMNTSCFTVPLSNIGLGVSMRKIPVLSAMHSSSPLLGSCNRSRPLVARPLLTRPSLSPFLALQYYFAFCLSCLPCLCLLQLWCLFLLWFFLLTWLSHYSFLTITSWSCLPLFPVRLCFALISVGYPFIMPVFLY